MSHLIMKLCSLFQPYFTPLLFGLSTGVSWTNIIKVKPWRAGAKLGEKKCHLGYHETAKAAALVYDKAVKRVYKGKAVTNFIKGGKGKERNEAVEEPDFQAYLSSDEEDDDDDDDDEGMKKQQAKRPRKEEKEEGEEDDQVLSGNGDGKASHGQDKKAKEGVSYTVTRCTKTMLKYKGEHI